VAIGTGLGGGLYGFVMMAGLAVTGIFLTVFLVIEILDFRLGVMAGTALRIFDGCLVVDNEVFVEFFDVTLRAGGGRLVFTRGVVALHAVLIQGRNVVGMVKNDLTSFVP